MIDLENPLYMIVGDYVLTVLLWLASLLQLAVVRDWTVRDTRRGEAFRWCLCIGLAGLALRFTFVLIDVGALEVPLRSMVAMQLIAIGVIGLAAEQILTRPVREDPPHRRASDWAPLDAPPGNGAAS
jgi:hypothetical protein